MGRPNRHRARADGVDLGGDERAQVLEPGAQRTIPGFEPSDAAFEPARRALDAARRRLADAGIDDRRHLDLWTALNTGLADQRVSNDPGGRRWLELVDDAVAMFLEHCRPRSRRARRR